MKAPFTLSTVGHIALAVSNPKTSAAWYVENLGRREALEFEDGVAVSSDGVTLAFFRGTPAPAALEHVSFHLPDIATLRAALGFLKSQGVKLEDPGDEIGPEAPGSPNMGLWLNDPDGYRPELNVQGGAKPA